MSLKSKAALSAILCAVVFSVGCGETFRPIAIPIIQNGGQPQASRQAVILSTAGTSADGSTTHVDVSGDTNIGQVNVGRDPVHVALVSNGAITVVVNRAEASLTLYSTFSPTTAQPAAFISLPVGSVPVFAYSNIGAQLFVAESGTNKVGVVTFNGAVSALTTEVAVGNTPVGLIATPDGTHLFVANKGDGTISVIDTGTDALLATLPNSIAVGGSAGSAPSYLTINTKGTRVFSVNTGSNNISVIDTSTDTKVDVAVGASPSFAYFDAVNNKLWVTNSGSNSVSVINVDVNSAGYLSPPVNIPLTPSCGAAAPKSITVLADGSRAYVADTGCGMVSVISTLSNAIIKTIPVGTAPISIISSPDSSKVYTANSGSGNVSIIQTVNDTVVTTLAVPAGSSPIYAAISPN